MIDATLVFLLKGQPVSEVLLGNKKTGFGQGKYLGFGGKVEPGEQVAAAALRELAEESGLTVNPAAVEFSAILEFHFPRKPAWEQRVYTFTSRQWQGIPAESAEMRPQWFAVAQIPYAQMWDDARYWLPRLLRGEKFLAHFTFKDDNATVQTVDYAPLSPASPNC